MVLSLYKQGSSSFQNKSSVVSGMTPAFGKIDVFPSRA